MSMTTAAMMSTKHDYTSLKELTKSQDVHETVNQAQHINDDNRMTKSEVTQKVADKESK